MRVVMPAASYTGRAVCRPTGLTSSPGLACNVRLCRPDLWLFRAKPFMGRAKTGRASCRARPFMGRAKTGRASCRPLSPAYLTIYGYTIG
jgi:hypothetical protein